MINACDFSGTLEMINQEGMGKQCINSEGVCLGLLWGNARLVLGGPCRPRCRVGRAQQGTVPGLCSGHLQQDVCVYREPYTHLGFSWQGAEHGPIQSPCSLPKWG